LNEIFHRGKARSNLSFAGGAETDVGEPMIDLIDARTLLIIGCTALPLAGLIGVLRRDPGAAFYPEPAIERSRCAPERMR
jgi:hypothetical protein